MNARQQTATRSHSRALLWPGVFALIAFGILMGLGTWQLQRLQWKNDIVARIEARVHAEPVQPPAVSEWARLSSSDYEYTRVRLRGRFDHAREVLIFRPSGGAGNQPGFHVLTPLVLSRTAGTILVNRGFVPDALKAPSSRSAGQIDGDVEITGLLRAPEARSTFTPPDEPARGLWFTRDPTAIGKHLAIKGAAPFSIDADARPNPGGWPRGGETVVKIRNDHLAYAMTWYGLAVTLLAVFGVFAWRRTRQV
jgi:surfeit locus 1 family protein